MSTLILGSQDSEKQHEMWKSSEAIWNVMQKILSSTDWSQSGCSGRPYHISKCPLCHSLTSDPERRKWICAAEQNQAATCRMYGNQPSDVQSVDSGWNKLHDPWLDSTIIWGLRWQTFIFNASMWGRRINVRSYVRLTLLPRQTIDPFELLTNNSSETPSLRSDLKNKWDMPAV